MLASRYRLKGKEEIDKVKEKGKLYQFSNFGFLILKRKDKEDSKFAFVVSTKVSKQAVQRNRVKRVLSETVRYEMSILKKGYDCVFLLKKSSARTSSEELVTETKKVLKKAKLI